MSRLISLHDKGVITDFMMQDPLANVLAIGDLDDFFWPSTVWYGWEEQGKLIDIALLYVGAGLPVLLCYSDAADRHTAEFCAALQTVMPSSVYTHLYPGVDQYFSEQYRFVPHGRHYKMALEHPENANGFDTSGVELLTQEHLEAINDIFNAAYPGNFFDPRMLETEMYYGIWEGAQLISIAGIHVYSEEYDVAGIGNVTTHPDFRNQGLAKKTMSGLIAQMQKKISNITLNVKKDNTPAVSAYKKLGFAVVREYDEFEFYRKA